MSCAPRLTRITPRLVAAVAAAGLVAGMAEGLATGAGDRPCSESAFFDNGEQLGDGVFLAAVRRGCADAGRKTCIVADGTGPIASETVDRGIRQDCVAFNQFIGAGLNQIAYYVTGECFGRALVGSSGVFPRRVVYSEFRCKA